MSFATPKGSGGRSRKSFRDSQTSVACKSMITESSTPTNLWQKITHTLPHEHTFFYLSSNNQLWRLATRLFTYSQKESVAYAICIDTTPIKPIVGKNRNSSLEIEATFEVRFR